jgi:hypothetical protein
MLGPALRPGALSKRPRRPASSGPNSPGQPPARSVGDSRWYPGSASYRQASTVRPTAAAKAPRPVCTRHRAQSTMAWALRRAGGCAPGGLSTAPHAPSAQWQFLASSSLGPRTGLPAQRRRRHPSRLRSPGLSRSRLRPECVPRCMLAAEQIRLGQAARRMIDMTSGSNRAQIAESGAWSPSVLDPLWWTGKRDDAAQLGGPPRAMAILRGLTSMSRPRSSDCFTDAPWPRRGPDSRSGCRPTRARRATTVAAGDRRLGTW